MSFYFPDGNGGKRLVGTEASSLPTASETVKGGVIVTGEDGLVMDGETLKTSISNATTVKAGLMSTTDKTKLDAFKAASNYVTVISGKGLSTEDFTTAEKNKLSAISVSSGNVVIDTSNLVVKESGKGLSTNDYTNADKAKLDGIAANANNYALPTASTSTKGGVKVGAGLYMDGETLKASVTSQSAAYTLPTASNSTKGGIIVTGNDGLIMDGATLKPAVGAGLSISSAHNIYLKRATDTEKGGIIVTGNDGLVMDGETLKTSISNATTAKAGLMSTTDKTKLDAFKAASNYVTVVSGKGLSTEDFTTAEKNKLSAISVSGGNVVIDTSNLVVKESGKGLSTNDYTDADKAKLSGIAANANNYTLPTASNSTKGGIKAGAGLTMDGETLKVVGYTAGDSETGSTFSLRGKNGGSLLLSSMATSCNGGSIDMTGDSVGGSINLTGRSKGGTIDISSLGDAGSIKASGYGGAGGYIDMHGTIGGSINLNGGNKGGSISLSGHNGSGGTIDLHGGDFGDGGSISLNGYYNGGTIDLSGSYYNGGVINLSGLRRGGSITGDIYFTGTPTFMNGASGLPTVTTSQAGLMSASDKTKLDGLNSTVSSSVVYIPSSAYDSIMSNFATVSGS